MKSKKGDNLMDIKFEMRMASKQIMQESLRAIKSENDAKKRVADV